MLNPFDKRKQHDPQQTNLDVTTNNLANVNTTGFKRKRADFADLLYQINREPGAPVEPESMVPTGVQVGLGTRVVGTSRYMNQGNLQVTDQPLDIAIEGEGFYQVLLPNGEIAYTRASKWSVDSAGQILNVDGLLMEPPNHPRGCHRIHGEPGGPCHGKIAGQDETGMWGRLSWCGLSTPAALGPWKNLFLESPASGAPIPGFPGGEGLGQVHQGILEMSNVQVVDEMVAMIIAQRAYEANSKGVQTADELLRIANGLKR